MVKVDFTEKEEDVLRSMCLAFSEVWLILGGKPYSMFSRDEGSLPIGKKYMLREALTPHVQSPAQHQEG